MSRLRNLLIFIADCLRYDYAPKSIVKSGTSVLTLAPSLNTPNSIPSIVSGRNAIRHNVRGFFDILNPEIPTVFEFFPNASYYDHPEDPMVLTVLRKHIGERRELTEMKEPFVWVERAMDTHVPYGKIKHGNEIRDRNEGIKYIHDWKSGKIDATKEYIKGVENVEQHFWTHVDELKNMGVCRTTLIVFTSDHGELLGEYGMRHHTHGFPPCKELVEVPTVFLNMKLNVEFMRSIDILPTAFGILGLKCHLDGCDGVDVRKEKPKDGINCLVGGRGLTIWKYNNGTMSLAKFYIKFERPKWMPIPVIPIPFVQVKTFMALDTVATLLKYREIVL